MLRSVLAIAFLSACHSAPAPTIVRATPVAAAPITRTAPVRQDFEMVFATAPGPLHEVLATGHECRQAPQGPINDTPPPLDGRRLMLTVTPAECARHRDGKPVLH